MSFERKKIQDHLTDAEIEPVLEVLKYLSQCEPSKAERTKTEISIDWFSRWSLGISIVLTVITALLAVWHVKVSPLPDYMQFTAALISLMATIFAFLMIVSPIVVAGASLCFWKRISFLTLKSR